MNKDLLTMKHLCLNLIRLLEAQSDDEYLDKEITKTVTDLRNELERLYSAWRKNHKDRLLIEHGLWHPDGEVTKIKLQEMIIKNVKLVREVEEYKRKLMAVKELAGKCL